MSIFKREIIQLCWCLPTPGVSQIGRVVAVAERRVVELLVQLHMTLQSGSIRSRYSKFKAKVSQREMAFYDACRLRCGMVRWNMNVAKRTHELLVDDEFFECSRKRRVPLPVWYQEFVNYFRQLQIRVFTFSINEWIINFLTFDLTLNKKRTNWWINPFFVLKSLPFGSSIFEL